MTGASAEETVSFCGRGIREPSGATTGALVALLEGDNVGWRPGPVSSAALASKESTESDRANVDPRITRGMTVLFFITTYNPALWKPPPSFGRRTRLLRSSDAVISYFGHGRFARRAKPGARKLPGFTDPPRTTAAPTTVFTSRTRCQRILETSPTHGGFPPVAHRPASGRTS